LTLLFCTGKEYDKVEKKCSGYQLGKTELWFHKLKFYLAKQFNGDRKGFIGLSLTLLKLLLSFAGQM